VQFNEGQTGIRLFPDEAREQLAKKRYIIYSLTGQSIKTLKITGRQFDTTWHQAYPDFEARQSRLGEVAINPEQLFLAGSNNKTLSEQLRLVALLSQHLSRKVPGVEATIAGAPDYVELAFAHLDETGNRLFGKDYNYNYARTVTPFDSGFACVGHLDADNRLNVAWHPENGSSRVWVAPLLIPAIQK